MLQDGAPLAMVSRTLQCLYGLSRSSAYRTAEDAANLLHTEGETQDTDTAPANLYETRDVFLTKLATLADAALEMGDTKTAIKLLAQWKSLAAMGNAPGHDPQVQTPLSRVRVP